MTSKSLSVRSLNKRFRDEQVLEDVDFELEKGEFCILLGPSGCGKSTLLHCIAGLHEFEEGNILLRGKSAAEVPIEDRDLGYVFQEFEETLFPHMTVEENVKFGLNERDQEFTDTETAEKIMEVLDLLSITHTKDSKPESLSGGQQQRVELARQLVRERDIMLLDDPLGDLDYKLQKHMEIELRRYQRDTDSTFLYTTHDQDQALKLADKLIVMNEGRIEQIGTPEEIYNEPQNAFVHRFIGDTNTLEGNVETVQEDTVTVQTDIGAVSAGYHGVDLEPGDHAVVFIRPEYISIVDEDDDFENLREGTLVGRTYTGEETELSIELVDTAEMLRVEVPGSVATEHVGNKIQVGWNSTDASAYGDTDVSVVEAETIESIQSFN